MRLSADRGAVLVSPPPVGRSAALLPVVGLTEINAVVDPAAAATPLRLGVDGDAVFTCGTVDGRCCTFMGLEDGAVVVAVAVDPSASFHAPSV